VLPVFRDGTSPLITTDIISHLPEFNGLCGFTRDEVSAIAQAYLSSHSPQEIESAEITLKGWYNGYRFCREGTDGTETLYNPHLVFKHLRGIAEKNMYMKPVEEITAVHISKVLGAMPDEGDSQFLRIFLRIMLSTFVTEIAYDFGPKEVLQVGKNESITASILYYLRFCYRELTPTSAPCVSYP
jgi:hypothetical protein